MRLYIRFAVVLAALGLAASGIALSNAAQGQSFSAGATELAR